MALELALAPRALTHVPNECGGPADRPGGARAEGPGLHGHAHVRALELRQADGIVVQRTRPGEGIWDSRRNCDEQDGHDRREVKHEGSLDGGRLLGLLFINHEPYGT